MSDTHDASVPRPFQVNVPVDDVYRMRRLVEETRLPESSPIPAASWDYGVDLDWLKDLQQQWAAKFDWKTVEADMNTFSHFKVVIESVDLHFIHQRSDRQDAIPLVMLNGWPGSFWEFHKAIPLLTNPPADLPAFHVVVPSLPGFGFSSPPPRQGWGMDDNARIFDHLMTGVLGYKSYVATGSDFGSMVCTHLGSNKFPACKLIQIVGGIAPPTLGAKLSLPFFLLPKSWRHWLYSKIYTEFELQGLARLGWFMKGGLGYFVEQATRPFTIGYALHDSPIGHLSWIGEKYKEIIHSDRAAEAKDFILATVSLYYLTGTYHTSTLPYRENMKSFGDAVRITKPYGVSQFAQDVTNVPVGWIKAQHPNMVLSRSHDEGGHFPAFEVPELLVADIQELVSMQKLAALM